MLRGRPAPPLPGWHAPSLTSPLRFPALEPAGRVLPSGHVLPSETGGARGGWNLWEDSDAFICTFCLTLESDFFSSLALGVLEVDGLSQAKPAVTVGRQQDSRVGLGVGRVSE